MKYFVILSRLAVGSLFIISGLIKCNDAIGFSYKLNDYFAQDVLNMEFLIPYSLGLAVMICVVEIVLGVALIFGFKPKLTTFLILIMMLGFTWLTWYTSTCISDRELATSIGKEFNRNCVEDCGCFGDALKLEPIESFYKDVVLLVFTIPLFFVSFQGFFVLLFTPKRLLQKSKIKRLVKSLFSNDGSSSWENTKTQDLIFCTISILLLILFNVLFTNWWFSILFTVVLFIVVYIIKNSIKKQWLSLLASYVMCLAFTYYCLQHLPVKDFRPYKVGTNIPESMVTPPDAPKAILEYTWIFKVDGEEKEFVTSGNYPEVDGEYLGFSTKTIDEGYIPPIQDFSIESDDEDLTTYFLEQEKLLMVTMYNIDSSESDGVSKLKTLTDEAMARGYMVIGLTSSGNEAKQKVKQDYNLNFDFYLCDEKVIKTIVRSNPGIVILEKGTVVNKSHWNDIEDIKF